jgi:hypothetical protein
MRRFIAVTMAGMTWCLLAGDGWAQTADPIFANGFQAGLIAFGPPLSGVPAGAVDQTTDTSLHVTLSTAAAAPTFVAVTSKDPSLISVSGGGVTVATGQTSAAIKVSAAAGAGSAPVTLWATLGNTVGAAVQILGDVSCVEGDSSDMSGYTRQCSGYATNYQGVAYWDNTYDSLFRDPWPGNAQQVGHVFTVTVYAQQYAAFKIFTGTTVAGIAIHPNNSVGDTGLASVSTEAQGPGRFPGGICYGSDLTISSKPATTASCKLSANSTYYLNFSMASYFFPYTTTCATDSCTTGWSFGQFSN